MIPLLFVYDEYIDRLKLSEQKQKLFEYIVPHTNRGVGTIIIYGTWIFEKNQG